MAEIKWGTIAAILILVLSFTMPFVPAHTALANGGIPTVYVSGTSGNDAWDGSSALYTGGTVGPKKTIWAGFTAVSTGGSIRVAAGTYAEHALTFDRTVAIMGTGPQYTIIDASSGNWNAIQASGGIGGTVWLIGVTIQNGNYTTGPGGVMVNSPWTVMMVDCIIKNNTGRDGGGICVYSDATLDMNRCTVSGNHATKPGYTGGGGIYSEGTATLTNCTISGNDATGWGGGLRNSAGASMTLTNCTVAYNGVYGGAGLGGGFYNGGAGPVIGVMTFKNTIVANNNASYSGSNGYTTAGAAVNSLGYNLDSENSCGFNQASDQRNTNPLLGPLQDNGYCTFTCAITASSPAYNRGTNTGAPATDQRLVPRPQPPGGACDIGAYELAQASATTATGTGTAWFSTINGYITGLTAAATTPCGTPPASVSRMASSRSISPI